MRMTVREKRQARGSGRLAGAARLAPRRKPTEGRVIPPAPGGPAPGHVAGCASHRPTPRCRAFHPDGAFHVFVKERSRSPASPRSPARPRQRSGKIKGQRLGEREGPRGATSCCCRLPSCCFPGLPRSLPTCSFMPQALCTPVTGKAVHSIRRRKPSRASACCLSPGSAVSCQQCGSLSFLSWVS